MEYYSKVPSKLYHYARFDVFTRSALLDRYIYIAAPGNENDEDELTVELERDERLLAFNEMFDDGIAELDVDGKKVESTACPYKMIQELRYGITKQERKDYGLYCLTDTFANQHMWDMYAGWDLCLEFDSAELFSSIDYCSGGIVGKVEYVPNRRVNIFEEGKDPKATLFKKTDDRWTEEREYRYININGINVSMFCRKLRFSSKAITGIYCGKEMDEPKLSELEDILRNSHYDNAIIYGYDNPLLGAWGRLVEGQELNEIS